MVTKYSKLRVDLEPALMKGLDQLAKAKGVSLSMMTQILIKEALETYEDGQWQKMVQERDISFSLKKAISHQVAWKRDESIIKR